MIRQGDVLFIPMTEPIPDKAEKIPSGVIQEGEVTGHHHKIAAVETAEVFQVTEWNGVQKYVKVSDDGVSIVHEEHHTVTLPPGTYRVHIAREYDYLAERVRYVAD